MSRASAAALALLACTLALTSLLLPWWDVTSYVEGSRQSTTHHYGPFHRGATPGDAFEVEVIVLGVLVLAVLFASALGAFAAARKANGAARAVLLIGLAGALGSVAYVWLAFPSALPVPEGEEALGFFDRSCSPGPSFTVCRESGAGWGWYAGLAFALLLFLSPLALPRDRRQRLPSPAPATTMPFAAATPAARPRFNPLGRPAGVPAGTTERVKCPRCQTWLSFARSASGASNVSCHNCGHRLSA